MHGKAAVCVFIVAAVIASGCVSSPPTDCGGCPDRCEGSVLLHDGSCSEDGVCKFAAETCEFGCSAGACLAQPPHLVLSENEITMGNFTVRVEDVSVRYGNFRDEYDVSLILANTGSGSSTFSISTVSLLSKTGIMHHATGFSWSDMLEEGEERELSFTIRRVPDNRRNQETTLIIRTNQGQYSFPATFSE